jgi:hypothetical protein
LENERLRVFGDAFQQLDVATVAGVAPNAIRLRILLTADEQDKHR